MCFIASLAIFESKILHSFSSPSELLFLFSLLVPELVPGCRRISVASQLFSASGLAQLENVFQFAAGAGFNETGPSHFRVLCCKTPELVRFWPVHVQGLRGRFCYHFDKVEKEIFVFCKRHWFIAKLCSKIGRVNKPFMTL